MSPIPSAGPFYNSNHAYTDARLSYYSVPFAPYGRMDGIVKDGTAAYPGEPNYLVQSDVDSNAGVSPVFNLVAVRSYHADSVTVDVDVTCLSAITSSSLKLRIAFTRSLTFATAPGGNGEMVFENVVRSMYPDATGTTLDAAWTVGKTAHFTLKGKRFSESLSNTTTDSTVVVWVQDDATKNVKQATIATSPSSVPTIANNIDEINISPNPATDFIVVSGTLENKATTGIKIIDVTGKVVSDNLFNFDAGHFAQSISLNNLCNGIYFANISANGETITRRFVINK